MDKYRDLLVSCSDDKEVRLWSLSISECIKVFQGNNTSVNHIMVLSERMFATCGIDIKFWDIEKDEHVRSINCETSEKQIFWMTKLSENKIAICGQFDDIRTIML